MIHVAQVLTHRLVQVPADLQAFVKFVLHGGREVVSINRHVFELGDESGWTYDPKNDRHYVLRRIPGVGEVTSIELIQNFDRELERVLAVE